jgi:hypothetical protein
MGLDQQSQTASLKNKFIQEDNSDNINGRIRHTE